MWFVNVPLYNYEITPTEEDIAPEDFIKVWYGSIDLDFDEEVSEADFLDWASEYDFYSWMSTYEVKTLVFERMAPSGLDHATFAQGSAIYVEVSENISALHTTWHALGFTDD